MVQLLQYRHPPLIGCCRWPKDDGIPNFAEFYSMVEESPHPFTFRKYEVLAPFGEPRTAAFCDNVKKEMPVILQAVFGDGLAREWRENPWKFKVRPKVVKYFNHTYKTGTKKEKGMQ